MTSAATLMPAVNRRTSDPPSNDTLGQSDTVIVHCLPANEVMWHLVVVF